MAFNMWSQLSKTIPSLKSKSWYGLIKLFWYVEDYKFQTYSENLSLRFKRSSSQWCWALNSNIICIFYFLKNTVVWSKKIVCDHWLKARIRLAGKGKSGFPLTAISWLLVAQQVLMLCNWPEWAWSRLLSHPLAISGLLLKTHRSQKLRCVE